MSFPTENSPILESASASTPVEAATPTEATLEPETATEEPKLSQALKAEEEAPSIEIPDIEDSTALIVGTIRDLEPIIEAAAQIAEAGTIVEEDPTKHESDIEELEELSMPIGHEAHPSALVEAAIEAELELETVVAEAMTETEVEVDTSVAIVEDSVDAPSAESDIVAVEAAEPSEVKVDSLPETSLNEEVDEQAEAEAAKEEDFASLGRKDLVKRLKDLAQNTKISDPLLRKLKAAYDEQFEIERSAALAAFLAEGGVEEDFEFRKDADGIEFEQLFRMVRERRKQQLEEIDKTKRINLKQKQQLIEDLKALNEQEESNGSLEEIRRIMDKWRAIGPVPHTDAQELFKNFDFQVDKFYSRRTEFFEMKELDRKRNLERKTVLLERAKKTLEEQVFVNGLREYNKIYEEFCHTGPAPRDENERLYTEIKAIGTQLHERKKSYDEAQRIEAERVAGIREGLLTQMDVVSSVVSETIAEWQTQTDLVQKLIAEWKSAGSRFRDLDPEISRRFWAGLKKFYAAKDAFFRKLDKERAENLARKKELLAKVQELATAENKFKAQTELTAIITEWKGVGPVAFKDRDKINKEFSKALDTFYDAKRSVVSAEQTEQRDNLAKKQELIDRLVALAAEKKGDEEELKEIHQAFFAIGFVPFKKKDEVNAAFKEAFGKAIDQTTEVKQGQKAYLKLDSIRGGGQGRGARPLGPPIRKEGLSQKGILNKRISGLENDVRNYRNNMDFIAATKNGEKLKAEFNDRISKAEEEIQLLRQQLHSLEKGDDKA